MNVLSLFDGISCGQLALVKSGIKYKNYYACEIDKHAIKVTQANFPKTIQMGDITKWRDWDLDLSSIDLIFAGFPCQAWSIAGNKLGTDDPRGELALVLLEILKEIRRLNPKVKFLFENVKMKNQHIDFLNDLFEHKAVEINSLSFCNQYRIRNYWTNICDLEIPKDREPDLASILESGCEFEWLDKERSDYVLRLASLDNKTRKGVYKDKDPMPENIVIKPVKGQFIYNNHLGQNGRIFKDYSATIVCAGNVHVVDELDGELRVRKITLNEYKSLQTIPLDYDFPISFSQAKKAIGNSWNVDTISYILKSCE